MLGGGFAPATVTRGIELGADVIAVDGGSTDSGPHYLGSGTHKNTDEATVRDLRALIGPALNAGIPLIVGSSGTSGTNSGVEWLAALVERILAEEQLLARTALIYSEQSPDGLIRRLRDGRIRPLEPAGPLDEATLARCTHIVGLMGHEPIAAAIAAGADIVLAGRATDTAVLAAVPLLRGCPPGPTWHAAKTAECGALCTTNPRSGGVLVSVDATGFTIEPLDAAAACTPQTVAAHMLYENSDPFRMREPGGTLDTSTATYRALDTRRVRVAGSRFEPSDQPTMKLEGATLIGYRAIAIAGIRDPHVLDNIDTWAATLEAFLAAGVQRDLALRPNEYTLELRCYGYNAVLGARDPSETPPREVGAVLIATAPDQGTATKIVQYANPYLLHMPTPDMHHLPSYAFMSSPAEIPTGPVYEFVLQHTVDIDTANDLVRTEWVTR
jgi:hypothetical protein